MISKTWLDHHQIGVYAVMLLTGAGLGLVRPELGSVLEQLIYPVLGVLLYVTFLQVPFVKLRRAFTHRRFMAAALSINFLVVPIVVWGLTRILPQEPALLLGVFMVLLTPCIDYVIVFTDLGGGDAEQITAATPVLMLAQLLLLPVYLWLFIGQRAITVISAGPFLEAFFLLIALPLGLAWATEV
jgi:ACR3 family arsenite transporter